MKELLTLCSPTLSWRLQKISNPVPVTVPEGVTIMFGANGAGKSTLGSIIEKGWNITTNRITTPHTEGKLPVKMIEFGDIHSLAGFHTEYYQQRLEATMNDDVPSVAELLGPRILLPRWAELTSRFSLTDITDKKVNYLSSGELRKLLLINTLLDSPKLLILDNPYIGLDAPSRDIFNDTLQEIAATGTSVMLLLCNPVEIPDFTDLFLPIADMCIGTPVYAADGATPTAMREIAWSMMDYAIDLSAIPVRPAPVGDHDVTFSLHDCRVAYGRRTILEHIDWTVHRGEGWALAGPNGSGKSLLLSLIYADNPQAYSNHITLFDKRRGSGESIWDIKRRIGYVSPEMHLYFRSGGTALQVVAQGLRDTVGNFGTPTPAAREEAMRWLRLLHMEDIADKPYRTLSAGMQRLLLIARTFIKHPDLLIFDEPLHGLDAARKRAVRALLNEIARRDSPSIIYVTHYLPEVPESVDHRFTLTKHHGDVE